MSGDDFSKAGTLTFNLRAEHSDWIINSNGYRFPDLEHEGVTGSATKHPDGIIEINIRGPLNGNYNFRGPIPSCPDNRLHAVVTWKTGGVILYFNAKQVRVWAVETGVHAEHDPILTKPKTSMFTPQELLVNLIDELRSIVAAPTDKSLFHSSRLLRHLLTDNLIHQANKPFKLKLKFVVSPYIASPIKVGLIFEAAMDAISPKSRPHLAIELNLQRFLACQVMELRGQPITVIDVIKYPANYGGAIHLSNPDTQVTAAAHDLGVKVQVQDMPAMLRALRPICEVTVAACEPLYEACKATLG